MSSTFHNSIVHKINKGIFYFSKIDFDEGILIKLTKSRFQNLRYKKGMILKNKGIKL